MRKKKRQTFYEYFAEMSREDQRAEILAVTAMCIDGAPVSLARKIEIYLAGENGPVGELVMDSCKTFQPMFEEKSND